MSSQATQTIQPAPPPAPFHLGNLAAAREALPPPEFRAHLRQYLLAHPHVTLRRVAESLGVSRQKVGWLAGRLARPTCAQPGRPAPEKEKAEAALARLVERVRAGQTAARAARELEISLGMAMRLGFRAREVRPPHGEWERARQGCNCWRCRRASGVAKRRGRPAGTALNPARDWACLDWLAWTDPDSARPLPRREVVRLAGVGLVAVSRIAREMEAAGWL